MSKRSEIMFAAGMTLTLLATPAVAQTTDTTSTSKPTSTSADAQIDDIVVTASKREEKLQDVPAAVSVVTGDTLSRIGATRLQDYVARVPGLVLDDTSFSNGLNQLTIRGLSTGQGANATVGIYIDDSPYGSGSNSAFGGSSVPDLDPLDLERVEVLRGPQGTLYGASTLGGLFKYVTAAPDPTHAFGRVEASGSAVDGGGTGYAVRGAANIPLADDLAVRASAYYRRDPGFIDNVTTGAKDVNDARFYGGRLSLGWKLGPNWTVRASALLQRQDADGNAVEDRDNVTFLPLYGERKQARFPFTGKTKQADNFFSLLIKGDVGSGITFTSASSYQQMDLNFNLDVSVAYGVLAPTPGQGVAILTDSRTRKWTQEFRFASNNTGPFLWQVGAFYTHEKNRTLQPIDAFDPTTGALAARPPIILDALVDYKFEEVAGFANVTYEFSKAFDITGGIRVSHNNAEQHEVLGGILTGPVDLNGKSSDTSWTWLVNPRLKLSADTMIYGRVATSYRPGGPNLFVPGIPTSYGPDRVINYEVGVKTSALNRKLNFDIAAFWIDWTNIQLNQANSSGQNFNGNGGKARSRGVETSLDWRAARGLDLHANVAYTDATLRADLPAGGGLIGFSGDQLPSTPKWSSSLGADYTLPVGGGWDVVFGGDWRYVGKRESYFPAAAGRPRYELPEYNVIDLRAGVRTGNVSILGYVRNVGNSDGQVSAYRLGPSMRVSVIRPRTYGLTVSTNF